MVLAAVLTPVPSAQSAYPTVWMLGLAAAEDDRIDPVVDVAAPFQDPPL
jgi:hypothetical protein